MSIWHILKTNGSILRSLRPIGLVDFAQWGAKANCGSKEVMTAEIHWMFTRGRLRFLSALPDKPSFIR